MTRRRSRLRAIVYAMFTGMLVGCGTVLALFFAVGDNTPYLADQGGGIGLMTGAIPAIVLVLAMAGIMRDVPGGGSPFAWALAGTIIAAPVAWLFGAIFREDVFEFPSVHVTLLVRGAVCGLAARFGYREVAVDSVSRNPSTTA